MLSLPPLGSLTGAQAMLLSGSLFDDPTLAKTLQTQSPEYVAVNLKDKPRRVEEVEAVGDALAALPRLNQLVVSDNSPAALALLDKGLQNRTLQTLKLLGEAPPMDYLETWGKKLRSCTSLTALHLQKCVDKPRFMARQAEIFVKELFGHPSLNKLWLDDVEMGGNGQLHGMRSLEALLRQNSRINDLGLVRCNLPEAEVKSLVASQMVRPTLTALSLEENPLRKTASLEQLTALTRLNMKECPLGADEKAKLKQMKNLQELVLE